MIFYAVIREDFSQFEIFWLVIDSSHPYLYVCMCTSVFVRSAHPLLTFLLLCVFLPGSLPEVPSYSGEDSWRQRARGSPMARAAVEEARLGAVALLDNMALTTTIIRALALELGVQVVLGSRLAEEELLA